MIIGFDGAFPKIVDRMATEGKLPVMASLMRRGVFADHCLVPFPTITPPNWTTIATGAWPGTHGITDFCVHNPGDPLDVIHQGTRSDDCLSEHLWTALQAAGKKAIVVNYPSSFPPQRKDGNLVMIDGAGLAAGFTNAIAGLTCFAGSASPERAKTFTAHFFLRPVSIKKAVGWRNLPPGGAAPYETQIQLGPRNQYLVLMFSRRSSKLNRVLISKTKDSSRAVAELAVGQLSPVITDTYVTPAGKREKGHSRFLLTSLTEDAADFRLVSLGVVRRRGWSYPERAAAELLEAVGPPFPSAQAGIVGDRHFVELTSAQNDWYAAAARHFLDKGGWSLFVMHAHCIDFVNHELWKRFDPVTNPDPKSRARARRLVEACYRSVDRMLGKIIEAADERTLLFVLSDHGTTAQPYTVPVAGPFSSGGKLLVDAGLLAYKKTASKGPSFGGRQLARVDWKKTKAIFQRTCHGYVNLKGRDPNGSVDPKDYDKVREEIIRALYDYTDPRTGAKPVAFALRREDARMIGHYSERSGDVVFGLREHSGGIDHGFNLPTAEYGEGQQRALMIMIGPGFKRNLRLARTMNITDVVPTLCHLTGFPVPADCEGGIVYQALERP
jgi:predicted AlkP superfamily phosphohydrolase/phosphomutase